MADTLITDKEFITRQSAGLIYICRSCRENSGKLMMLGAEPGARKGVRYGYCSECLRGMECIPCKSFPLPK